MTDSIKDVKLGGPNAPKMPKTWKEKLVLWLVTIAIGAWLTSPSWMAYYWSFSKKRQLETEGWIIVSEGKGGELIYPWSLVFPYTNSLGAVDPKIHAHTNESMFLVSVLSLSRGTESDGPIDWLRFCVFDTKKSKVAIIIEDELGSMKERIKKMKKMPDDFLTTADWKDASSGVWKDALDAVKLQITRK